MSWMPPLQGLNGVCHLAGTMACNGHGNCRGERCACSEGWTGPSCRSPPDCGSGLVDKSGSCCASGLVDKEGGCCPDGTALDHSGSCCYSGRLDACGTCDGKALHVDVRGQCCPGILDASGTCCSAEMVDECGVCGGDSSTCGVSAEVAIRIDIKSSDWQGILKATSLYLSERLEPRGISTERISIVGVDVVNTQDLKIMASIVPGGAHEPSGMLPDLPNHQEQQQSLHLLVRFVIHSAARHALPHERSGHNDNHHLPVRVLTLAELHEVFEQTGVRRGSTDDDAKALDGKRGGGADDGLMEAFRIGNAAREATCGNGWCEWGEQARAGHPANASYCPRDCDVSFKACPSSAPAPAARQNDAEGKEPKACAGNGLCTGMTGACSCHAGYAGIDCSTCAMGYLMDAATANCVPLVALSDPDAVMKASISSASIHPDAEAHRQQAAGSSSSSLNTTWIVVGAVSGTVALSIAAVAAYIVLSDCRRHERKPATAGNVKQADDAAGSVRHHQAAVSSPGTSSPSLEGVMTSRSPQHHHVQASGSLRRSAALQCADGPDSARSGSIFVATPPAPMTSHHGSNSSVNFTSSSGAEFNLAENMQRPGLADETGTPPISCSVAGSDPDPAANSDGQTSSGSEEPTEADDDVPVVVASSQHQIAEDVGTCSGVDEDPNPIHQQQTRPGPSSASSSDASSAKLDPSDGALSCGAADKSGEEEGGTGSDQQAASDGASSARGFDDGSSSMIVRNPIGSPYRQSRSCSCIDDASLIRASSLPIITGHTQDNETDDVGGSSSRRTHSLPFGVVHSLSSADKTSVALPSAPDDAEDDEVCIQIPDTVHSPLDNADA